MLQSIIHVIIFLLALVFSNVINKIFPKLALPLVQVLIGILFGFGGISEFLHVDPEFFLGFIIAPLLFRESEEAEVKRIVKHRHLILVLIFPLVFVTALGLGGILHLFYMGIPLAACLALGAALAPTDAIAVGTLSTRFVFPQRVMNILQGEGLFNDASGIVSFQIAVLALVTGSFSLPQATMNLLLSIIGGFAIGIGLSILKNKILQALEDVDAQDVSGYLMLEFVVPLAAFALAEVLDVSGIIAVVVAGILQSNGLRPTTVFDAQVTRVKNSVWETIVFMLNSSVFIFLGIELHSLVFPFLFNRTYSVFWLIFVVLLLTLALFALRFLILLFYYLFATKNKAEVFTSYWSELLLLTFSGTKGTVSIATILLLPELAGNTANLLIFFCTSVTGLSFLVSLIALPYFAVEKKTSVNNLTVIAILGDVVQELRERITEKAQNGYHLVIADYQNRIQKLIVEQESAGISANFNTLQLLIIRVEIEGLEGALEKNHISMRTYRAYHRYIRTLEQNLAHDLVSSLQFTQVVLVRALRVLRTRFLRLDFKITRQNAEDMEETRREITNLYLDNTELVLETLENLGSVYDAQLVDFLQSERLRLAEHIAQGNWNYVNGFRVATELTNIEELMEAYYLERKVIFDYEHTGRIELSEAKKLRQTVNLLEEYALASDHRSFIYDLMEFRRNKRKRPRNRN
ncbi:cation:proton antiporter [Lactococcus garvieae]|uniref:Na+/H+ antiporter n=1 Tax=Lactococcus garvieae DCC43 TaxID=1231377 RepID=K2NXA3_9LACT|nr:sodium:proton antiporter [Lactococcus garvieae]EKF52168.1 Na+/H+ antiporter [Lactococcus garvieae DCC43]